MRHFALRPTVLLVLGTSLAGAVQSFFDFDTDFLTLPESARQCLDNSASFSGCTGETAGAINTCLCSNGGNFVIKTAACVGSSDPDDLGDVYDGLNKHCADSETPLSVGKADFMKSSGVTTTRTQTKTSSTIMQPTSTGETKTTATSETTATGTAEDNDNELGGAGKLSSTAKAGIIAGAVSGGLLVVGLAIFFFVRNRRKNKGGREESHPMLSQNKFGSVSTGALEAGSRTSKTSMVSIGSLHDDDVEVFIAGASLTEPKPKKRNWKPDTKWRPSSGFNWESPYEPPWSPPPPEQEDWVHLPLETAPATGSDGYQQLGPHREVFELASPDMQPPVEMSGSPLDPQRYSGVEWETTKTTKTESNDESKR